MDRKLVRSLLDEALELNTELFLVSFDISDSNQISVIIDGDKGVSVSECMRVSRNIDQNMDREEEDFSLEVSSFDISHSLTMPRQYVKNIGRKLKVKTVGDEKFEGTLLSFTEDNKFVLQWKERVPKTLGKGKMTVEKQQELSIEDVKEAKVVIIF
ncbi:MAG: ribosome assembly cofactor RimP [Flavobacteriales bacterium]|nr:ribosome assembly cofactor RimP [Flavobacteriales bacterium]